MTEYNAKGYDDQGTHWTAYADCQDPGAPNMFPADNDEEAIERARRECDQCPVRMICLDTAIRNGERFGVWGGVTPKERVAMTRHRRVVLVKVP